MVKGLPETVAELTSMSSTKDKKKQKKRETLKEMGAQDWDSTINQISKIMDTMYKVSLA